jgi:dUTP pyrophosphatase
VLNSPGTVDSDYRGEVKVLLINLGREPVVVAPLDRIAQIVFAQVTIAKLEWANSLSATARGDGGYGSTGAR